MIIDEIKKANLQAMRDRNSNLRAIYGIVINKYMQVTISARTSGKEVDDAEVVRILQKTIKELEEEAENYLKVNHQGKVEEINDQRKALELFMPQLMSKDEIAGIINSLPDKSIPFVMRYFKQNYDGKCNMGEVQQVLREV